MRIAVVASLALALLAARPAGACSTEASACDGSPRLAITDLVSDGIPRDGVLVFYTQLRAETCEGDPAPAVEVEVLRAGQLIPGATRFLTALPQFLVWQPDELLEPGSYTVRVDVDNTALPGGPEVNACAPPRREESWTFSVSSEVTTTPELPPPSFELRRRPLTSRWDGVACCPGVTPTAGTAGDCLPKIGSPNHASQCIYLYDHTYLEVSSASLPDARGQYVYDLVIGGEIVSRSLYAAEARRGEVACAYVEATHLGTGEVLVSAEACPPDDLAAQVGPQPHAQEFPLACDQALACGTEDGWDPDACAPYDPAVRDDLPPPAAPLPDDALATPCAPPSPAQPGEDAGATGCACDQGAPAAPPWALALLVALRRRRSSRTGPAGHAPRDMS